MTDCPPGPVVPIKDSTHNTRTRDVVGNKEDIADNSSVASVIARLRYLELQLLGATLPMKTGNGNPNGVTSGALGQKYQDLVTGLIYVCVSNPAGTVWSVI